MSTVDVFRSLSCMLLICALAACGDDDVPPPAGDAGTDGGGALDLGVDGGPLDAGDIVDAGDLLDAGPEDASTTDAAVSATVTGTLTLPGTGAGRAYGVRIALTPGAIATPIAQTSGVTTASAMLSYSIPDVPAGTYYLLAFVDVDGSGGGSSTPGDYAGWYGHSGDGNPPAGASVVVPASGTVTYDVSLVIR